MSVPRPSMKQSLFKLLCFLTIIILSSQFFSFMVNAVDPTKIPELPLAYEDGIEIFYESDSDYRYAGVVYDPGKLSLVVGAEITYIYPAGDFINYKMTLRAENGVLGDNDDENGVDYEVKKFSVTTVKQTLPVWFNTDEYLITDGDFNFQLKPQSSDIIELQYHDENFGNSFKNEPGTSYNWKSIGSKEWAVKAMVEEVALVEHKTETVGRISSAKDKADAYYVNLVAGKTYVFNFGDGTAGIYQYKLYNDVDVLKEENILKKTTGGKDSKSFTYSCEKTGRYLLGVFLESGSGDYNIIYRENRIPVAIAGEDQEILDLVKGTYIKVDLDGSESYDPDDDINSNRVIDGSETDNLDYFWDFDAEEDGDKDGIKTNDKDMEGKKISKTIAKAGEYTFTLNVVDIYGSPASDYLEVVIRYMPVIDAEIDLAGKEKVVAGDTVVFRAKGSFDPDDDIGDDGIQNSKDTNEGNGVIDGVEQDTLQYWWDLDDTKDTDYDGNFTNDADVFTPEAQKQYKKAGSYNIWLTLIDTDNNNVSKKITLNVEEKWDWDEETGATNDSDENGDVVIYKETKTVEEKITITKDVAQEKVDISHLKAWISEPNYYINIGTSGPVIIQDQTNIEGKNDHYEYWFYFVSPEFKEEAIIDDLSNRKVKPSESASTYELYITLIFSNGKSTVVNHMDNSVIVPQVTMDGDYNLSVVIPAQQLPPDLKGEDFGVFGMVYHYENHTIVATGEKVTNFFRDSAGIGAADAPIIGDVDPPIIGDGGDGEDGDGDGGQNNDTLLLIAYISAGVFVAVFIIMIVIAVIKKRKADKEEEKKKKPKKKKSDKKEEDEGEKGFSVGDEAESSADTGQGLSVGDGQSDQYQPPMDDGYADPMAEGYVDPMAGGYVDPMAGGYIDPMAFDQGPPDFGPAPGIGPTPDMGPQPDMMMTGPGPAVGPTPDMMMTGPGPAPVMGPQPGMMGPTPMGGVPSPTVCQFCGGLLTQNAMGQMMCINCGAIN